LAPYLFLLVGEAFNMAAKEDQRLGKIQGIQLPESEDRQLLSQYADDNGVSIIGQKIFLKNTVDLISRFGFAFGLIIHWTKSIGYWFSNIPPFAWLNNYGITWAPPHSLSKLLGAPFGVSLETADVETFLQLKITKKLKYWTTQRLSLAGHAIVVNAILLSSFYYFLAIWCGSIQAIRSARGSMRNFLWSGSEHLSRTRVSWNDCCLPKSTGGLQLLDPEVSLNALLAKWVMYAIEPGISGLKTLLRYRIHRMKPHPKSGFWFSSASWLMVHRPSVSRGSRIWNRIIFAWKKIVKQIKLIPPTNASEVLATSIWWSTSFIGSNFNFSID